MDLSQLFAGFESADSTVFLIANLISFLFGFILAWILWGGRARRLRSQLAEAQGKLEANQTELESMHEKLTAAETEVNELEENLEIAGTNLQNLQLDYDRVRTQSRGLEEKVAELEESVATYESNIESLNEQVLGLRTRNQALASELERAGSSTELTVDGLAQMQSSHNAMLQRLSNFETKLDRVQSENQRLRDELDDLKSGGAPLELGSIGRGADDEPGDPEAELDDTRKAERDAARAAVRNAIGTKVPKMSADDKDDLKLINGIGPFLENQLNEIGIYAYAQIAAFDQDLVDQVTTAIGFFPGRIVRDDWAGQATRLSTIKEDHPEALTAQAVFPNDPENLKVVEGIGPKIEEVLKNAGVATWSELAASNDEQLRDILLQAGDRFRMHNPATWPKQAQLAVDGQWEELRTYQDELKGGREE